MASIDRIVILGAGPAGLSAALALAQQPCPPRITLVEVRPRLGTIGGTVNLTPLAVRYLDRLGAGPRLRARAMELPHGVDYVSLRTGRRLGNFWGGIGGLRILRHALVESMFRTLVEDHPGAAEVLWGKRTVEIAEDGDQVVLEFEDGETLRGDLLLGCDGVYSAARRLWVEPERKVIYSGRAVAMGFVDESRPSDDAFSSSAPPLTLSTGELALIDTAMYKGSDGLVLASYYEPSRSQVYFAHVMAMEEPAGEKREGWKLRGKDKEGVEKEVMQWYRSQDGRVGGLGELLSKCDDWILWPVYILAEEGRWSRGRAILLGDASHAMPPQGESTGLAIEDGVLMARILERRGTRTVEQLLSDLVTVRKAAIDKYARAMIWEMEHGFAKTTSWWRATLVEWATWLYLLVGKRWRQENYFGGDVSEIELPA